MDDLERLIDEMNNRSRLTNAYYVLYRFVKRVQRFPWTVRRETRHGWQRLTRGWDDRSLWNLDGHLTKTLGEQLIEMAHIAHGWPAGPDYPRFEDWTFALRRNGNALIKYHKDQYDGEDGSHEEAKTALMWVAENLPALWD